MTTNTPLPPGPVGEPLRPIPTSAVARFADGFRLPMRGAGFLLRHAELLPLALAPVLLNLVVFALGVGLAVWGAPRILDAVWPRPDGGAGEAAWTLAALLATLVVVAILLIAQYLLAGLLATPFLDRLSERIETLLLGPAEVPTTFDRFVRDVSVSVAHSVLALLLYAGIMGPLLLLDLVPGFGAVISTGLGGVASSLLLARELLDGPLTRRRLAFGAKLGFVMRNRAFLGGLGACTVLLLWVPGLNLLLQPLAVAGATLGYCRLEAWGRGAGPRR